MTHAEARGLITARIAAITPAASYASSSFALESITWAESPTPLIPEVDVEPDTLAPLAFWVDNRTVTTRPTRSGHDPMFVNTAITVRFLYPFRENGPPADDWDRAAYALEALVDQLLDPTWAESAGDLVLQWDSALGGARCRVLPSWLAWEVPFRLLYERTT